MNDDSASEGIKAGPPPPEQPKATAATTIFGVPPHTFWFLVAFYLIAVAWGIREIWFWIPSAFDLLIAVTGAFCVATWAIIDARRRKRPIPMHSQAWFFLLAGVVVPGYVIGSRGWRGLGWLLLNSVCWYVLTTVVMHVGGLVVFGDDWLRAMGP
jgi:hypothetical protein